MNTDGIKRTANGERVCRSKPYFTMRRRFYIKRSCTKLGVVFIADISEKEKKTLHSAAPLSNHSQKLKSQSEEMKRANKRKQSIAIKKKMYEKKPNFENTRRELNANLFVQTSAQKAEKQTENNGNNAQ